MRYCRHSAGVRLIWRRRHLPPPTRQAVLRRADGRYYLDRRWERLFFTSHAVRQLSDRVGEQLERALSRGGLQP